MAKSASLLPYLLLLAIAPLGFAQGLNIRKDDASGTITVHRADAAKDVAPLLTQNAAQDFRPYLHPIMAPDGKGELTQFSPGHHKHQTGLYWGLTRVNGRDYFHNPKGDYWRRVSAEVLKGEGGDVSWRTVYAMLDEAGAVTMTETQTWTMSINAAGQAILDLAWNGKAGEKDVTVSKYPYGGMFLRMPWEKGKRAHVMTAARVVNEKAEGKRSMWLDVGMEIAGRDDDAHFAIFDHPQNDGFPNAWRVDGQFGVGASRAIQGDWSIGAGKDKTFLHRFVIYTGKLNEKDISDQWKAWSGQKNNHVLWGIAREEAKQAKFLNPDEAVAAMKVADGFAVNAFAAEPMITQPMAFCWDDRGRMWIAENRDYESRGKGFSNSGDSRILILEDTNLDGVADSRKVFLEGIPFPAGIAVGMGGLWLGTPPNLLFVPDKDGDDKGDMDAIEVRLTGWGIRDRHETLNSFHWGPDGWLYGTQGFATPSKVGKPKGKGRLFKHGEGFPDNFEFDGPAVDIDGGVWRYHPTKDRFEVVAHGFSNPWGIDYNAKGQLFITACVIPHLWHVIPGGIYHRQGGSHFNPYVYSDIRTIADHDHLSAHGGARVYLSDAFPEQFQGQLIMANLHEHSVMVDKLEPSGSGYIGRHSPNLLDANNAQWIGFSVEIGPDGNVYVLDWHDADICGQTVLHKETGRVFRIAPKESRAKDWKGRYGDLMTFTDAELVELQKSPSSWHARRARVILQGRAVAGKLAPETHGSLLKLVTDTSNSEDLRLQALWALHVTGGAAADRLLPLLDDKEPHLRAWAIQLLCEDNAPPAAALERFAAMAKSDPSPVVRLYLASAMQRLTIEQRWPIAAGLLSHDGDIRDHNLPKMLWFAIEPMVAEASGKALDMVASGKFPILQKYAARRAAQANAHGTVVALLARTADAAVQNELLAGMLDGIGGGGKQIPAPEGWASVYEKLKSSQDQPVVQVAQQLALRFGDDAATATMLAAVSDNKIDAEPRRQAIRGLAAQRNPGLAPKLTALLDDDALRLEAIRAIAAFDDEAIAGEVMMRYDRFSADDKRAAVQTLASRPKSGWLLAQAIRDKKIPRTDIPAYIPRQLHRVVGSGFLEIWGPVDELPEAKAKSFEKYRQLLTDDAVKAADPHRGKEVFAKACATCHKMYGAGGDIGPDITGSNRADLNYILDNMLDPSAEIPEGYQLNVVTTRDGRNFGGTVGNETDSQLVLRQAVGGPVTIDKADIQSRERLKVSMMPEGLLATLKDDEVVALIRYLRTTQALPEKK